MPAKKKRRRPPLIQFGQWSMRWLFRVLFTLFYGIRIHGLENYPENDGLLICCNHQSYLDPLILGSICPRPVNYLGRKTLFKSPFLAWFMKWNDTIAIDREATGIGGMKDTLRRIKRGESVVIFPEGTRTPDGKFHSVMLGFCAVAKRTKSTLLPIGFDGAFQAFPKKQKFPVLGRIHVVIGKPISYSEFESLTDQQTGDLLESRMRACFDKAHEHWERSGSMMI